MGITCNQDDSNAERIKHTSLSKLIVPKFTTSKIEVFMDNLKSAVSHVDGIHRVPIDCLLREVGGNYNDNCKIKREKLKNCL